MCLSILLRAGAEPDSRDLVSATPLHKAVAHGDARATRVLLQAGSDLEAANMYGDRALHRAVENSRIATSRYLLKCGADPNVANHRGDGPLHLACVAGQPVLVNMLLSQGAMALTTNSVGWTPLHTSVACQANDALDALINFHKRRRLPWRDLQAAGSMDTPLHLAVRTLRMQELTNMVVRGGFENALVVKNADGRTVSQLLAAAIKQLRQMAKKAKRAGRQGRSKSPPKGGRPNKDKARERDESPGRKKKGKDKKPPKAPPLTMSFEEAQKRLGAGGIEPLEATLKNLAKKEAEVDRALAKEREQARRKKEQAEKAKAKKAEKAAQAARGR